MENPWRFQNRIFEPFSFVAKGFLPLCARVAFAAVLLVYFWSSARSKSGEGPLGWLIPSDGAFVQIFPRQMEAVGYDIFQLGLFPWVITIFGTAAEFILPVMVAIGLFSRFAALGMIGFILVQSLTDYFGHGLNSKPEAVGAWFDNVTNATLLDQRVLWIVPLLIIICLGGGWLSIDRAADKSDDHDWP